MKTGLILIDVESYMSSVSLIEAGKLKEHYVEYKESTYITGNIYKGKVVNVLTGLQSAFVDFGGQRNGFLSVGETVNHRSVLTTAGVLPTGLGVKEGDYVMVQATKEEIGNKGARLTSTVSIPGRYLIFLPTLDFVGVSNKITDEPTREKLTKFAEKLRPAGAGFIIRTACLEAKKGEIAEEAKRLINQWKKVSDAYDKTDGIGQVYSDGDFVFRSVRDMLSQNVDAIVCNDRTVTESLKAVFGERNLDYADRVRLYAGQYDILDAYGVMGEVDRLLDHKVKLRSGVSLVFDYTEALTVIDVNTSGFARGTNHEETVFRANLDAAREIARQIRLRNIGGIIVIDFIDMTDDAHKEAVVEELRREMLFDRTKTRVIGMSSLGLVEVTRKKVGREISTVLLDRCPFCNGDAHAQSVDYVARKIKVMLRRLFADDKNKAAIVTLNARLADAMFAGKYFTEDCETTWRDKRIYLVPDPNLLNRDFSVKGSEDSAVTVPAHARLLY